MLRLIISEIHLFKVTI